MSNKKSSPWQKLAEVARIKNECGDMGGMQVSMGMPPDDHDDEHPRQVPQIGRPPAPRIPDPVQQSRPDPRKPPNSQMPPSAGDDGPQISLSPEDLLRLLVKKKVKEIVRKNRDGEAGYTLYAPNQGKGKPPKPVGRFGTKAQAKAAELNQFPPRDPEKKAKAKKNVERLKKHKKVGEGFAFEGLRDQLAEAAMDAMDDAETKASEQQKDPPPDGDFPGMDEPDPAAVQGPIDPEGDPPAPPPVSSEKPVSREEESRWEDLLSKLSDTAVKKDPQLRRLVKKIQDVSLRSLERAVKSLTRGVKGVKVSKGKVGTDKLDRPYTTVTFQTDSGKVGPVYIYIKGELLHVVSDGDVKSAIMKLDPEQAKSVREALQELPHEFDSKELQRAVEARDEYLEGMEVAVDDYLSDLDALELSMLKKLVVDKYTGDEPE